MFLAQELRWLERLKQEHPSTTVLALSKGRGGLCVLPDTLEVARGLPSGCPWSCRPVLVASIHPIPPSAQEHQGEFPTLGALGVTPGAAGSQRASEPFPRAG